MRTRMWVLVLMMAALFAALATGVATSTGPGGAASAVGIPDSDEIPVEREVLSIDEVDGPFFANNNPSSAEVDYVTPVLSGITSAAGETTADPLGLVVYAEDTRRYSVGTDTIGVYVCTWPGASGDVKLGTVTNVLNADVKNYYDELSGGTYKPNFIARKVIDVGSGFANNAFHCGDTAIANNVIGSDNAVIGVMDNSSNGGLATSGNPCPVSISCSTDKYPANSRWAVVDGDSLMAPDFVPPTDVPHLTTAVHEIGHTLGWPHSFSTLTILFGGVWEYDNPIDVMSANADTDLISRVDNPYATNAWNRYRAGWIDTDDVLVYEGGVQRLTIAPAGKNGTQLVVLPTDDPLTFITLDARRNFGADSIPGAFQGVTAHFVRQPCTIPVTTFCWGLGTNIYSYPPAPDNLNHVTKPGETLVINLDTEEVPIAFGTKVKVISGNDNGYVVDLIGFSDAPGSVFFSDILWMAEEGITKGCGGSKFCPQNVVTRGQMAAFLVRALDLGGSTAGISFTDTGDSIFENDIKLLAKAGITKGCNPPANNKFCPDATVTRGQMAAFLVRALDLGGSTAGISFTDTGDSIFENDIKLLAKEGITKGCNPPANNKFCPNSAVTRGAMAAFLKRALG